MLAHPDGDYVQKESKKGADPGGKGMVAVTKRHLPPVLTDRCMIVGVSRAPGESSTGSVLAQHHESKENSGKSSAKAIEKSWPKADLSDFD